MDRSSEIRYEQEHFCDDCYHCRYSYGVEDYCGHLVTHKMQECEPGSEECAWAWRWDELAEELTAVEKLEKEEEEAGAV